MNGIYLLLKLNRMVKSPRLKFLAVIVCRMLGIRYISLRIDPAKACNLKCRMCSVNKAGFKPGAFREEDLTGILDELMPMALQVVVGCGYEPTVYSKYLQLIKMASDNRVPFKSLTTNAQLLSQESVEGMVRMGLDEITVSLHGVRKETYEDLMPNASFEKLHNALAMLDDAKARLGSRKPALRLNYTVNSRNAGELGGIIDVFGRYDIATIQLRPMFGDNYTEGALSESDIALYRSTVAALAPQCRERDITLLANVDDEKFSRDNIPAIIFPEVHYYVNPDIVWRDDFDWRKESYRDFCRRIKYTRYLMKCIFLPYRKLLERKGMRMFQGAGRYDVIS